MAVQIGINNTIFIRRETIDKIFLSIKQYFYETGGIIGVDEEGIVAAFEFDQYCSKNPHEYCPNVDFLNRIINKEWVSNNIEFIGFVHSHIDNCEISYQDIKYSREILDVNKSLESILIGVVNFGEESNEIMWYLVSQESVVKLTVYMKE